MEELESKVEQLEATVQGLTEELVEVHDRLETLEAGGVSRSEAESSAASNSADASDRNVKNDDSKNDESQKGDETGGESELGDDIIVA
ncbi:hypothetical protein BRC82_01635 [Halobacteriales archaeon QS_1_67_19]|nr:MAG: hypothetical protein BRC82_01635 [Halobacteriales archaeon QS_1_67_19]